MKNEIKNTIALNIQVSVSHSVRTKISQEGDIWRTEKGYRTDTQEVVRREEGGDNRGKCMSGSHTYAGEHTALFKYSTIHGISQGEKYTNDIRQTCKFEIQVWKSAFLV